MLLDSTVSTKPFFNMRPTGGPSTDPWERGCTDRSTLYYGHAQPRQGEHFPPRNPDSLPNRMSYGSGGSVGVQSMGPSELSLNSGANSASYQTTPLDTPLWSYQSTSNNPATALSHMGSSGVGVARPPLMSVVRPGSIEGMSSSADSIGAYHPSHTFMPRPQSSSSPAYGYSGGGGGPGLSPELPSSLPSSYDMPPGGPGGSHSMGSGMVGSFGGSSSYSGPYSSMGGDLRHTTTLHSVDGGPYYSTDFSRGEYMNSYEVKHRRRTTKAQFRVLEDTFQKTPKPSADVRRSISEQLDMPPRAVQIWFQNRRAKAKNAAKRAGTGQSSGSHRPEGVKAGSSDTDQVYGTAGPSSMGHAPGSASSSSNLRRDGEPGPLASPTDPSSRSLPSDSARSSAGSMGSISAPQFWSGEWDGPA